VSPDPCPASCYRLCSGGYIHFCDL
jgi:hypothetical protein